jgi:hypothetical protein
MKRPFLKGALIGGLSAAVVMVSSAALAGTGIGAVFNLGKVNSVNAQSALVGSSSAAMLRVKNSGSGRAASFQVKSGHAPFAVNTGIKVPNLNSDRLDNFHASELGRLGTTPFAFPAVVDGTPFASTQIKTTKAAQFVAALATYYVYTGDSDGSHYPCLWRFQLRVDGGAPQGDRGVYSAGSPAASLYDTVENVSVQGTFVVGPGVHTVDAIPVLEAGSCSITIGIGRLVTQVVSFGPTGGAPAIADHPRSRGNSSTLQR